MIVWTADTAASTNLISLLALCVLLATAFTYRIIVVERMLIDTLGEPYAQQDHESWRLRSNVRGSRALDEHRLHRSDETVARDDAASA